MLFNSGFRKVLFVSLSFLLLMAIGPDQGRAAETGLSNGASFHLTCLGVGGGDLSSDLTSLMLQTQGHPTSVVLDGGSVAEGLVEKAMKDGTLTRESDPEDKIKFVARELMNVEGIILTHSHLDHVSGFSVLGPLFLNMHFQWKYHTFRVIASPETFESIEKLLYSGKIWGNFGYFPKGNTILGYERVAIDEPFEIAGLTGTRHLVDHPVESSAFLLENKAGGKVLFFGDTGQLKPEFYAPFTPFVRDGSLKGMIIEVSFPAASADLARKTCHLTRDTLLLELAKLAGLAKFTEDVKLPLSKEKLGGLAFLVSRMIKFPIFIVHIKPWEYKTIASELQELRTLGIDVVISRQGESYDF